MDDMNCPEKVTERPRVYFVVHELFGIYMSSQKMTLVTPCIEGHTYKMARFKSGNWKEDLMMEQGAVYSVCGLVERSAPATALPCHREFSPFPPGKFPLSETHQPYCRWILPIPKQIYQLRTVVIPEADRPLFRGDPHGDMIEAQVTGISLVHVFEYEMHNDEKLGVFYNEELVPLGYELDTDTNSVNLHLWAQMEDEQGMDQGAADCHAYMATKALVALFDGLRIKGGAHSLAVGNLCTTQVPTPDGILFPELMTLAERFQLKRDVRGQVQINCTARTCGHGGSIYVNSI